MSSVAVHGLTFGYGERPVLRDLSLTLEAGWRCLLVGANGAGKSTLLRLLGGKHLTRGITVLGRDAFHDTSLAHEVVYVGQNFPVDVDLEVSEMLAARQFEASRGEALVRLLGVDRRWHMHQISDGQRRRVQLLLALLRPRRLLLLDEATADLDLLARLDFLALLRQDCATEQTTVLYATHVLDGLERWATHVAWLDAGRMRHFGPLAELAATSGPVHLSTLVESWLRQARPEASP